MSTDVYEEDIEVWPPEDTMKILLATDCHLGYEGITKKSQENDSFITFEEILQHAQTQEVDFILLGGDLFHDSKPSQKVVTKCVELLKKYALGDRGIQVEFLSDPETIFSHMGEKVVNYEHPNINISMPIFSIHGSHDNPGFASIGSMDLLGATALVNYFGKNWGDMAYVTIPPMVFGKGRTYVSIYGLGCMDDRRLSRLLRDGKLTLLRPATKLKPFNIMVLHQNRAKSAKVGYVEENKLPGLLDLVFWGLEHECRVEPEHIQDKENLVDYNICQPGSSIATSLHAGEAVTKKIGLLEICRREFRIQPIKLETVRPFVFDSISLDEIDIKLDLTRPRADVICDFVDDYIENVLLEKAQEKLTGDPNQPTIPLIRLRVFYTDEAEIFDVMRFDIIVELRTKRSCGKIVARAHKLKKIVSGTYNKFTARITRKYQDKVANAGSIVLFQKKRATRNKFDDGVYADMYECFRDCRDDVTWDKTVQSQIRAFFDGADEKYQLQVLSVGGLNEALKRFVELSDDDAFDAVVNYQIQKNMEYMKKFNVDEEQEIIDQLNVYRDERIRRESAEEEQDNRAFLESIIRRFQVKVASASRYDSDVEDDDVADNADETVPAPTRGRGRGSRGGKTRAAKKTTARGRGRARGRGKAAVHFFAPNADSSVNPTFASTSMEDEDNTSFNQFRAGTSTRSLKQTVFVDDSDSN